MQTSSIMNYEAFINDSHLTQTSPLQKSIGQQFKRETHYNNGTEIAVDGIHPTDGRLVAWNGDKHW